MKKKILSLAIALTVTVLMSVSAFADLTIKPVPDPWDDPSNQEADGASYYAHNEAGYVVVWETPECNVDGKYVLVKNKTELTVEYRVTYMESVPWGHVNIELEHEKDNESEIFSGWVLMTDLVDADGNPAAVMPPEIPDHPMISNPVSVKPTPSGSEPSPTPNNAEPTPTPTLQLKISRFWANYSLNRTKNKNFFKKSFRFEILFVYLRKHLGCAFETPQISKQNYYNKKQLISKKQN